MERYILKENMQMNGEQFIKEVRLEVSEKVGIPFQQTSEIDSEVKAIAALAALTEWEEAKTQCKRG
jgi:hypothetical protein